VGITNAELGAGLPIFHGNLDPAVVGVEAAAASSAPISRLVRIFVVMVWVCP